MDRNQKLQKCSFSGSKKEIQRKNLQKCRLSLWNIHIYPISVVKTVYKQEF
jgi:hypothetical protein